MNKFIGTIIVALVIGFLAGYFLRPTPEPIEPFNTDRIDSLLREHNLGIDTLVLYIDSVRVDTVHIKTKVKPIEDTSKLIKSLNNTIQRYGE